jgi:hypothetical protein
MVAFFNFAPASWTAMLASETDLWATIFTSSDTGGTHDTEGIDLTFSRCLCTGPGVQEKKGSKTHSKKGMKLTR